MVFKAPLNYKNLEGVMLLAGISIGLFHNRVLNSHSPGRFTEVKKISKENCGKNEGLTLMYSMSRRDATKKLWMHKPFFNIDNEVDSNYELVSATNEVFFGELAVAVFGKKYAPKTKFNPELRGVISRIVGDDVSQVTDLLNFCNDDKHLPQRAQQTLLASVIYSLVIGDRDLHLENLVIKYSGNATDWIVYGIDHEFAIIQQTGDIIPLSEVLTILDSNPAEIVRLLLDTKFHWNILPRNANLSEEELEIYSERLLDTITHKEFIKELLYVVETLEKNDFKLCYDAKEKIYKSLRQNTSIYTPHEIEKIVAPNLDVAINDVKNNVAIVRNFIEEQHRKHDFKHRME